MKNEGRRNLFSELDAGLREYLEYRQGKRMLVVDRYAPSVVAGIRAATGLSQAEFASLIGVSVRTLQNWEQGHRSPTGPARALLTIVRANPKFAIAALHGKAQPAGRRGA